jgi:subtilisin family serine protease
MRISLILLLAFLGSTAHSTWYWVRFTDKEGVTFNPYAYFHPKALERRKRHGLPVNDISDYPVKQEYLNQVSALADSVSHTSRWLNAGSFWLTDAAVAQVKALPFVREVVAMDESRMVQVCANPYWDEPGIGQMHLLKAQTARMGGEAFSKAGLNGTGIRIAILDAGFRGTDVAEELDYIRQKQRIIKTWDFVRNKPNVYGFHTHGTMVMSCVGGTYNEQTPMGLAPEAEFLLARTERIISDGKADEKNWIAALEWADKEGADIINTSLAYTGRRYFPFDMDGATSIVAMSAHIAKDKGMLVVVAAGNEGNSDWYTLGSPADSPDVLTVGAINPWTNLHTSFSSFGPTADHRLKPNVAAYGHTMAAGTHGIEEVTGTSFSSPLVAGFAACLLQADTSLTVTELFLLLEKSAEMYPYYDYAHGYGVPQAARSLLLLKDEAPTADTTFTYSFVNGKLEVHIKPEYFTLAGPVNYQYYNSYKPDEDFVQDSLMWNQRTGYHVFDNWYSGLSNAPVVEPTAYVHFHIQNNKGWLDNYYTVAVRQKHVLSIDVSAMLEQIRQQIDDYWYESDDPEESDTWAPSALRVYYKGFVAEINLENQ